MAIVSEFKSACAAAVEGRAKIVAVETFGGDIEKAQIKVSRRLGDMADTAPSWELLDNIFKYGHAGPILDYFAVRFKVEWRRIPDLPSVLRARAVTKLEECFEQLELIREELEKADEAEEERRRA